MDILLDASGDMKINKLGDIELVDSVRQAMMIKVRWLAEEWRWDPDEGLPYIEELLVKNPDTIQFATDVTDALLDIDGITDVRDVSVTYDRKTRQGFITFTVKTDSEQISEEVDISCLME